MNILKRLTSYSPNLKQSWMLLIAIMLFQVIAGIITRIIIKVAGIEANEWGGLSGELLAFVMMAAFVIRLGKYNKDAQVTPLRQSPIFWILLVPFTLSISLLTEPLTAWIPMPEFIEQLFTDLFQRNLSAFLLVIVIAPVCEEWLCRGIILKGLLTHYSPRKAIVWSAVIFGLLHVNPWQAVSAFFIALAIGWIYWRTRLLRHCIFMHVANNATIFALVLLFPEAASSSLTDITGGYYIYAILLAVCAITTIVIKKIMSFEKELQAL